MRCSRWWRSESGQAAVEAALMLPVFLVVLLLLIQPAILLYDRMVMQATASEACRLMATLPASDERYCEDFVRRRLGAIPQQDCFHVHEEGNCTWSVNIEGDESSAEVSVSIATELRPLPLFDAGAALLGMANEEGNVLVRVSVAMPVQPEWVAEGGGKSSPSAWVGSWTNQKAGRE